MEQAISKDMCLHRKDKMKQRTVTEKRFGEYHEDDKSITLRSRSATCGGGSEVLVICFIRTPLEQSASMTTKAQTDSMSNKES